MPAARESLLNAALAALGDLPWSAVRMVDVAAAAGVSRQTLYNEFGSKDGLARALVRREADAYLRGVERLMGQNEGTADRLVSVAEWTVGEARTRPVLRALLTGCWGERMPVPRQPRSGAVHSKAPAQRRADARLPVPADLVAAVRDRSLVALRGRRPRGGRPADGARADETADLSQRCELAVRLALSCVVAPAGGSVAQLVRAAVGDDVTATSPRAAGR
ncbi:TetR/AcrR family transcriptional regulator [Streptomyces xantholiticus]|uniref:TetR/AcrR family transcriptional regulator n=1 Tax=Streptomyces xantholiticus TaxID=68285 RepID=UPI0016760386|nr:TetR/AcrR family transcriptional regulator [Streptomyces xantholiticus]GGW74259.1 TetR family transcriptional regulator [Streptomyces xantholiticus]